MKRTSLKKLYNVEAYPVLFKDGAIVENWEELLLQAKKE